MRLLPCCIALALAAPASAFEAGIELSVAINAPPAEVWKAWASAEGVTGFLAPAARIEPRPEGAYEIFLNPYAEAGKRGSEAMEILAIEPEKLLSFSWRTPASAAALGPQRTVVMLRFKPLEDGRTEVTLSHVGWGEGERWDRARQQSAQIWAGAMRGLKARFDKGPYDWTDWHAKMRALQEKAGKPVDPSLPPGTVSTAPRPAATAKPSEADARPDSAATASPSRPETSAQ